MLGHIGTIKTVKSKRKKKRRGLAGQADAAAAMVKKRREKRRRSSRPRVTRGYQVESQIASPFTYLSFSVYLFYLLLCLSMAANGL